MKLLFAILFVLLLPVQGQYEINNLCLFLHEYSAPGINVARLHAFLEEKGWENKIAGEFVDIKLDRKIVHLLPDGNGTNGLADFCDNLSAIVIIKPPVNFTGIKKLPVDGKIVVNATFSIADNDFLKKVKKVTPLTTPLGLCAEGIEKLQKLFRAAGYETLVAYNPANNNSPGHIWLIVLKNETSGIAIDSYYGIRIDQEYYKPFFFLRDFSDLYLVNPQYRIN